MNRSSIKRVSFWPQNRRLVNLHLPDQREYYAKVQKERYSNALKAGGIKGLVYNQLTSGQPCDCSMSSSLLDDEGKLTPEGFNSVANKVEHIYSPSERVSITANNLRLEDDEELDLDPDFYQDNAIDEDNMVDIGGIDQNRCSICFNTGRVGGYTIDHGNRHVLTHFTPHKTDKELVVDCPSYFKGGQYVTFYVTLARWPEQKISTIRVWNNNEIIPSTLWALTGIDWGKPSEIHLICRENLTHVEIQTTYGHIWLDFPQLPSNFEPQLLGSGQTTTIHLPSDAPVGKWSIIKENKFNRTWQVNQVNPHYDTGGILVWLEADVRLVANHEIFNQLMARQ